MTALTTLSATISRDEAFKPIFDDPAYTRRSSNTTNRGLTVATYAAGPYIRNNIIENITYVRKEFMKYLEIELTDFTALEWFDVRRRPTERPLVSYMRLKYHLSKHLLKSGDNFQGTRLTLNEQCSPSIQRFIVMEYTPSNPAGNKNFESQVSALHAQ